ncbi:MAG: radical SAM protein [Verrucomicrobia bacterium]|nr:radical SAM protein [Verrucomicrobiota bacterium]
MTDPIERVESYRANVSAHLVKLSDVLPLRTPFSIMIDPANACNFRCSFCPTGDFDLLRSVQRPKGVMSWDLFCKIIDDVSGFDDKVKVLWLHKDGEPFLNKSLGKMIAYAKDKGIAESIRTVTNGSLLTTDRAVEVIEAGLDYIKISIEHVSDTGYKEVTQTATKYESILQNVRSLYLEKIRKSVKLRVYVKILDIGLSQEEKQKFLNDFSEYCDEINIEEMMGWSKSNVKDFTLGQEPKTGMCGASPLKKNRIACPEPFKGIAINFDGSVSVCCVDWSHGTVVGNASKESVVDIWQGEHLLNFRLKHLTGKRHDIDACRNCQFMLGLPEQSDIDDALDTLRARYQLAAIQASSSPARCSNQSSKSCC